MRKLYVFLAIPLAVLSVAVFTVTVQAEVTTGCPAGYSCTPVTSKVPNCPAGYVCRATTTTNTPSFVGDVINRTIPSIPKNSNPNMSGGLCGNGFTYSGSSCVSTTNPSVSCYMYRSNLSLGSTGADVVAIQSWLMNNGYSIPAVSSGRTPKGYYGSQTAYALGKYQDSVGITMEDGELGPLTRSKLNGSCGTEPVVISDPVPPELAQPSITIVYPQAGYKLMNGGKGSIANIKWTNTGSISSVGIMIVNSAGVPFKYIISSTPNTGSYLWLNDASLPNGTYSIQIFDSSPYTGKGGGTSAVSGNFIVSSEAELTSKYDMPVLLPSNTTETWAIGDNHIIKWTYPSELAGKLIQLSVVLTKPSEYPAWSIFKTSLGVSVYAPSNGEAAWSLLSSSAANDIPPGEYNILVSAYDSSTGITHKGISSIFNLIKSNTGSTTSISPLVTYCKAGDGVYGALSWNAIASGGKSPYTYSWSVYNDVSTYTVGSTQSASFGATYSSAGTKQAIVRVTDAAGATVSGSCSGTIISLATITPPVSSISINPASLQLNLTVGQSVAATFQATGVTYAIWNTSGTLPAGVYTSSSGNTGLVLKGAPTQVGTYTFTVKAGDFYNPAGAGAYSTVSITVNALTPVVSTTPLTASCLAINPGGGGIAWNATVSGGKTPYAYSWSAYNDVSSYTTGSTQSATFGALYSTPGSKQAVVRVTDASGAAISASCSGTLVGSADQSKQSITVLSPSNGAALVEGSTQTISWSSTGLTSADYIHIMLTDPSGADKVYVAWWLPGTQTSFSWKVGTGIGGAGITPPVTGSSNKIKIYTSTGSASDSSDNAFVISAGTTNSSASAAISLSPASPLTATVPVSDTTNGQYLGLPSLVFNVTATGDSLHLSNVKVNVSAVGTGSVGAAYLWQGSTQIASASVIGGVADFQIPNGTVGASIPANNTVDYVVKLNVTGVTTGQLAVSTSVNTASVLNSSNSAATVTGSASGTTQTVVSAGPLFTIVGTPTITKTNLSDGVSAGTLFQYTGSFNVNVQAIGTDVVLGLPASSQPAFGAAPVSPSFAQAYKNGVVDPSISLVASYTQPSNVTLNGNSFTVARNQSVTIPVTYSFTVANGGANTYGVQLQGIQWSTSVGGSPTLVNFMSNNSTWRSALIMNPQQNDVLTASIWDAIKEYFANGAH